MPPFGGLFNISYFFENCNRFLENFIPHFSFQNDCIEQADGSQEGLFSGVTAVGIKQVITNTAHDLPVGSQVGHCRDKRDTVLAPGSKFGGICKGFRLAEISGKSLPMCIS
jgi:hypothetical protein